MKFFLGALAFILFLIYYSADGVSVIPAANGDEAGTFRLMRSRRSGKWPPLRWGQLHLAGKFEVSVGCAKPFFTLVPAFSNFYFPAIAATTVDDDGSIEIVEGSGARLEVQFGLYLSNLASHARPFCILSSSSFGKIPATGAVVTHVLRFSGIVR